SGLFLSWFLNRLFSWFLTWHSSPPPLLPKKLTSYRQASSQIAVEKSLFNIFHLFTKLHFCFTFSRHQTRSELPISPPSFSIQTHQTHKYLLSLSYETLSHYLP